MKLTPTATPAQADQFNFDDSQFEQHLDDELLSGSDGETNESGSTAQSKFNGFLSPESQRKQKVMDIGHRSRENKEPSRVLGLAK